MDQARESSCEWATRTGPWTRPRVIGGEQHGPTFWILLVVGWIAIAIGLFGVFDHPRQASAFNVFRLLVGLNIVNDAIAIPALLLVAWAVRRWVPAWLPRPYRRCG